MKLYRLNIEEIKTFSHLYPAVHFPLRYKKALSYRQERDFLLCVGSGYILCKFLGIPEDSICVGAYGKPFLSKSDFHFNISHSGQYLIIGVDKDEIGVDIEKITDFPVFAYDLFFVEEEIKWFQNDILRFFQIWTAKEAIIKAVGKDFLLDPKMFSVLDAVQYKKSVGINGIFLFLQHVMTTDYCIACCTRTNQAKLPIIDIYKEDLV